MIKRVFFLENYFFKAFVCEFYFNDFFILLDIYQFSFVVFATKIYGKTCNGYGERRNNLDQLYKNALKNQRIRSGEQPIEKVVCQVKFGT